MSRRPQLESRSNDEPLLFARRVEDREMEQHKYGLKLAPITVRSHDGFSFTLDVSQIIHIGMKQAQRVISRVGSMQNLVDHVLQPTVAN